MTSMLSELGEALSIATQDYSTFERAEACYQATFRSTAYSIESITDLDWLEEVKAVATRLIKIDFLVSQGYTIPVPEYSGASDDLLNGEDLEAFEQTIDWLIIDIPPQTLICDLCNYKGEGEGIALYDAVKHLPIFRSKSDSFSHFGA